MTNNVVIHAPAAVAAAREPTPEEMIQLFSARIRELESELAERALMVGTLANISAVMARRLVDLGYGKDGAVLIPRDVSDRTRGTQVTVSETADGDLRVFPREVDAFTPLGRE